MKTFPVRAIPDRLMVTIQSISLEALFRLCFSQLTSNITLTLQGWERTLRSNNIYPTLYLSNVRGRPPPIIYCCCHEEAQSTSCCTSLVFLHQHYRTIPRCDCIPRDIDNSCTNNIKIFVNKWILRYSGTIYDSTKTFHTVNEGSIDKFTQHR